MGLKKDEGEGGEDGNVGEGTTHKKEIPLSDNHDL